MNEYATEKLGAKILGWAKFEESGLTGGVSKFITEEIKQGLEKFGAKALLI